MTKTNERGAQPCILSPRLRAALDAEHRRIHALAAVRGLMGEGRGQKFIERALNGRSVPTVSGEGTWGTRAVRQLMELVRAEAGSAAACGRTPAAGCIGRDRQ